MRTNHGIGTTLVILLCAMLGASRAIAMVVEVRVAITPTCPYGLNGCWGGAHEALRKLSGVRAVAPSPDAYNCMADIHLQNQGLPDVQAWEKQFLGSTSGVYGFRGVEVTVRGLLEEKNGGLFLKSASVDKPIALAALKTDLRWNFKKRMARQPEADETAAFKQLTLAQSNSKEPLVVEITGPLQSSANGPIVEVREYFLISGPPKATKN